MRSIKVISLLFIFSTCFLLWIWVSVSSSRAFRLEKLPDKGDNWNCATCHVNPAGGGAQNAFGKDYREIALPAGDRYTKELGETDSDGDGFTNDEEFNADPPTKPWDAESKPAPRSVEPRFKRFMMWAKIKTQ